MGVTESFSDRDSALGNIDIPSAQTVQPRTKFIVPSLGNQQFMVPPAGPNTKLAVPQPERGLYTDNGTVTRANPIAQGNDTSGAKH